MRARRGVQQLTEVLHPEETITTFILIRHGHTAQTEGGLLYNDHLAELTDRGVQQARSAAAWLPVESPDLLLSSKALRVTMTAGILSQALGLPVSVVEGLDEWHIGAWEGRTYLEIKKSEPDVYAAWSKDPIHNAPPGGESVVDLCQRVQNYLSVLSQEHKGKRIALVTHAGIIRAFLVHALGMPVENFWRISVPTGSISKIDFSAMFATVHYTSLKP